MTIQFKFRSSVGYDSVELDGKPSISVKDLRAKIVQNKSVRLGQDFDLVIANPETGEAYEDENFQVLDGSNVIIMRVPVGEQVTLIVDQGRSFLESTAKPVAKHKNFGTSFGFSHDDIDVNEFDDFGVDLYHVTEPFPSDTEVIDRKNHIESGEADSIAPRCSGSSLIEQILMPSVTNEFASGGFLGKYGDKTHVHIEMPNKMFESQCLDEEVETNSPVMLFTNLPPELKCSLCNAIFKDAVMIPCCQHSFCDKCIGFALVEKAQCPKCSSKCSVKDLLPNVSLRQAIHHFLEAQAFVTGPEKHHRIYVADEESGIHAREVSCDPSILQREPALLHSPSATGKGSNQIAVEFVQQSLSRNKGTSVKSSPSLHKIRQNKVEGEKNGNASFFKSSAEVMQLFGCDKKLPQHVHEGEDGSGNFVSTSRHRKGDRNCYLCGSPNHLLRDCPRPSSSSYGDPMFHGTISAYGTPYCHGGSMTHVKPFASVYGALGMMPFEPRIFPVTPFAIPSYIPSFYPELAMPYGFMRMGGFSPQMMAKEENCLSHVNFMGNHDDEPKKKIGDGFQHRDHEYHDVHADNSSRDYQYNEQYQRRSAEEKHHSELYSFRSYSGENEIRRSRRKTMDDRQSDYWEPENGSHTSKCKRDRRSICSDKTNSDPYRMPSHSVHHKKEKSRRHHGRSSRRHCENREVADNSKREETDDKYKFKHHNHSHAGSKRKWKGNDSNHSSKPSKHRVNDEELNDDRWEMVDGPHDDGYDIEDYYQYHKHRRTH